MEEKNKENEKYESSRQLLSFIAQHRHRDTSEHAQIITKMNSCFAHHDRKRTKFRTPLQPLKHPNASHHLRKNQNKIQHNIMLHRDACLKSIQSRRQNIHKKTQLIANRPYYLQYFTPKTQEQICFKHQTSHKNDDSQTVNRHKSPLTSVHVDNDDWAEGFQTFSSFKPPNKCKAKKQMSCENFKQTKILLESYRSAKKVNKEISSYCRQELESYYQSLSKFSKGDPKKYKDGLETMLSLMNVSSNDKILTQQFNKFQTNPSLEEFIACFMKIVDAALRENVMDFFDIVFQECGVGKLDKQQLIHLLSERMRPDQALEIVEQIFYLVESETKAVCTADILALCCTNDQFCWFMRQFSILENKKK